MHVYSRRSNNSLFQRNCENPGDALDDRLGALTRASSFHVAIGSGPSFRPFVRGKSRNFIKEAYSGNEWAMIEWKDYKERGTRRIFRIKLEDGIVEWNWTSSDGHIRHPASVNALSNPNSRINYYQWDDNFKPLNFYTYRRDISTVLSSSLFSPAYFPYISDMLDDQLGRNILAHCQCQHWSRVSNGALKVWSLIEQILQLQKHLFHQKVATLFLTTRLKRE